MANHPAKSNALPKPGADSISVHQAGQELGSQYAVYQAIGNGELQTRREGRMHRIPCEEWERWKATRAAIPPGYVALASIRDSLGIQSDKLSEYARAGLIPTATQCNLAGAGQSSPRFGTWHVAKEVAQDLLLARHAGKPMPWFGRPNQANLRKTYRRWLERKHPAACKTCYAIWGNRGAPKTWEAYAERYPALSHAAKRHLTMQWSPKLSAPHGGPQVSRVDAAAQLGVPLMQLNEMLDLGPWFVSGDLLSQEVLKALHRRLRSRSGHTIEAAAAALGRPVDWVLAQIEFGKIVPCQGPCGRNQAYLSESTFRRLAALASGEVASRARLPSGTWLSLSQAASDVCVSVTTVSKWAKGGGLKRVRLGGSGDWRYELHSLRARARRYWQQEARGARGQPPDWLSKADAAPS